LDFASSAKNSTKRGFSDALDIKDLAVAKISRPNIFQAFIWNFLGLRMRYQ
jgi:hypothetical protein